VGDHTLVNHNAVVGHDARMDAFSHLCPGVKISGFCQVGEGAFLATNAVVIPSCSVGAWASVGAGTVVLRDLPEKARLVPVPGRVLHGE
jgi:acetyltransferase EpsM